MNILLYLIPIALTLGLAGLLAFFWASKNGQFEDLDGAPYRMLREDEKPSAMLDPNQVIASETELQTPKAIQTQRRKT